MAEASDTLGIVYQNLKDAGCDERTTNNCMSFARGGNLGGMLPILKQYRRTLLGSVRSGQKKLDCLDYLIYKIQKELI